MTSATHGGITDIDYGAMIRALNEVHYAGETSFYGKAPLRPCEELLFRGLPAGSRILDVGCGAGRVTRAVSEAGGEIIGVDVNSATLKAARDISPHCHFEQGSMTSLPFPADRFDAVWCLRFSFNALPTESERRETLSELWRVCAPGGSVLIEVFNWNFAGRFGLVRVANILETAARATRWLGQGRVGSPTLPTRDIIYLANKDRAAAPGYAHLTTARELCDLAADCCLRDHSVVTDEASLLNGSLRPVWRMYSEYSMWLVLRKPERR